MEDWEDEGKKEVETAKEDAQGAFQADSAEPSRADQLEGIRRETGEENTGKENTEQPFYCPWCGRQIPGDSVYCENCGGYVPDEDEEGAKGQPGKGEEGAEGQPGKDEERAGQTGKSQENAGGQTPDHQWLEPGRTDGLGADKTGKRIWTNLFALAALAVLLLLSICFFAGKKSRGIEQGIFYIKDNSLIQAGDMGKKGREYSAEYQETWGKRSGGGILKNRRAGLEGEDAARIGPVWSNDGRYLFYPEQVEGDTFELARLDRKKGETKTLDTDVTEFFPAVSGQVVYRKENEALYVYGDSRKRKLSRGLGWYQLSEAGDSVLWTEETSGVMDVWYEPLGSREAKKTRLARNAMVLDASGDFSEILIKKENSVYRISGQGEPEARAEEISGVACADAERDSFYFVRDVNRTPSTSYQELYYFDSGKISLLTDELGAILWQDKEMLLYTIKGERDCHLAHRGRTSQLGREAVLPGQVERRGEALYFFSLSETENEGAPLYELCRASLSEQRFGLAEDVDRGISKIACVTDSAVYYFKDVKEGQGDLYKDGECVAYDAAVDSVAQIPGSEAVLCIADYSSVRQRGTLVLIESGASRVLADDISGYSAVSEDEIYLLSGYRFDKERGDLLFSNGRELRTIDTNIWGAFGIGNSRICRYKDAK